jgi:putative sterol carrier protein
MPNPFLSDPWLDEVQELAAEAGKGIMPSSMEINLVVTGAPEGDKELHVAEGSFAKGLKADCPTKITMPFTLAKDMFIKGDQQAAMQAFMSGQIKIEGDMSKLMALQSQAPSMAGAGAEALQAKLREITSDFD